MSTKTEINQFLRERDAAFLNTDLDWARSKMPGASSDRVIEAAFHKARLLWTKCPAHLQEASRQRLAQLGSRPIDGESG